MRPSGLLAVGATFASTALSNTDMYDCNYNAVGVPVPDDNTFNLPLEKGRQDRYFPLCLDDPVNCIQKVPVCFDFRDRSLTFAFANVDDYGYTYIGLTIVLSSQRPASPKKTWTLDGRTRVPNMFNTAVTCTLPDTDLVVGATSLTSAMFMCALRETRRAGPSHSRCPPISRMGMVTSKRPWTRIRAQTGRLAIT